MLIWRVTVLCIHVGTSVIFKLVHTMAPTRGVRTLFFHSLAENLVP